MKFALIHLKAQLFEIEDDGREAPLDKPRDIGKIVDEFWTPILGAYHRPVLGTGREIP